MATINIDVVIDAQTIFNDNNPGTFATPTPIPHEYIYMVTQPQYVASTTPTTQATADLSIVANVGDNIRWTFSTLSQETMMYALPYQITTFGGTNVMTTPIPLQLQPSMPIMTVPIPNTGPAYTDAVQYYYTMQATIASNEGTSPEQYMIYFMLVTTTNNLPATVGYYSWDPTINVTAP
ncbi:AidA/PixA family protein [Sphingomonas sp. CJ20]